MREQHLTEYNYLTDEEFNAFMRNLGQPENQVPIKKKMSKEYPSLTEEEYAGFMANIRRFEARDEKRKKAALATGDANNSKPSKSTPPQSSKTRLLMWSNPRQPPIKTTK